MCILTIWPSFIGPSFHVHVHWIFWKLISYNGKLSFFSSTIFIPFSIFLLQNWWNYYFFMTGAPMGQGNKSWFWFFSYILSMLRPLSFLFIYICLKLLNFWEICFYVNGGHEQLPKWFCWSDFRGGSRHFYMWGYMLWKTQVDMIFYKKCEFLC